MYVLLHGHSYKLVEEFCQLDVKIFFPLVS